MTLVADVGSPIANSYVTVAEADAYFDERANASLWSTSTEKESLLITASRLLDWQLKFKGSKTSELQSMSFPRSDIELSSGYIVPSDSIPTELKWAVFELALLSVGTDRVADNPLAGIDQVKAGSLFIKTAPPSSNPKTPIIPDYIRTLLKDFTSTAGVGVYRLIRG